MRSSRNIFDLLFKTLICSLFFDVDAVLYELGITDNGIPFKNMEIAKVNTQFVLSDFHEARTDFCFEFKNKDDTLNFLRWNTSG